MDFISKTEIPISKKVAYANMVCDIRHFKDDNYKTRLIVGGDKLEYIGDSLSPAPSLV